MNQCPPYRSQSDVLEVWKALGRRLRKGLQQRVENNPVKGASNNYSLLYTIESPYLLINIWLAVGKLPKLLLLRHYNKPYARGRPLPTYMYLLRSPHSDRKRLICPSGWLYVMRKWNLIINAPSPHYHSLSCLVKFTTVHRLCSITHWSTAQGIDHNQCWLYSPLYCYVAPPQASS